MNICTFLQVQFTSTDIECLIIIYTFTVSWLLTFCEPAYSVHTSQVNSMKEFFLLTLYLSLTTNL